MNTKNNSKRTIDYYNVNAEEYFKFTYQLNMSKLYKPFLGMLPPKASILDVGCGSGRDSHYFLKMGYKVTSIDASKKMVDLSNKYLSINAIQMDLKDVNYFNQFEGIWACAVLLHVSKTEMYSVMLKMLNALKSNGVIYASFKYGAGERFERGRLFSYYDNESMNALISKFPDLEKVKMWKTIDIRKARKEEYWLNTILRKA